MQRSNLIEAIKSGGLAAELGPELKAIMVELERLKAIMQLKPQATHRDLHESIEQRVARMRERLAQGGEVAQGVVRELFPAGYGCYPDPDGRRFLWAYAVTADPQLASLTGADGRALTDAFPRVYNATATNAQKVGDFGSAGTMWPVPTLSQSARLK
jgi:hypothetical protein